jgi:hypothetical protein
VPITSQAVQWEEEKRGYAYADGEAPVELVEGLTASAVIFVHAWLEVRMQPSRLSLLLLACLLPAGCGPRQDGGDKSEAQPAPQVQAESEPWTRWAVPPADAVSPEAARDAFELMINQRDKDLSQLEPAQAKEVLVAITKLVPKRGYDAIFDFRPWYVWEFQKAGEAPLHVLFEVNNSWPHPGSTGIRLTVFDRFGKMLSETSFDTGHRCYMRSAKLEEQTDGQYPIVMLKTGPGGGPGPNTYKQYLACVGDRFDLIRLENSEGKATRNDYAVRHFTSGPTIPVQTEGEWLSDLLSSDRLKILRALVWLGGTHCDLKAGDAPGNQEEGAEAVQLVRKVRENKMVIGRLKALAEMEDLWIKDAARLALEPADYRF